jgi:hypothetical protein
MDHLTCSTYDLFTASPYEITGGESA